jgi:hypothetical protein
MAAGFRVMTSLKPMSICIGRRVLPSIAQKATLGRHCSESNLVNRCDDANGCEVVADASKKINISFRSGNRHLPDGSIKAGHTSVWLENLVSAGIGKPG